MTFPSGNQVSTTELSAGTGNPATARQDIYAMAVYLNQIIASENLPLGVAVLNGAGQVASTQIPSTFSPDSNLVLSPSTGFVKIQDILRLQVIPKADLLAYADVAVGDFALCADDLTGANPKLAYYDGTNWRGLDLSTLTIIT